jgi:hypothetical protein
VGADNFAFLYAMDGLELIDRPLAVATDVQLRIDNPGIATLLDSVITLPADSGYFEPRIIRGVAPGRTTIRATDARGDVFSAFAPAYADLYVVQPTLRATAQRYFAAPGLVTTAANQTVDATPLRDSVWVRLSTRQGRAQAATDSLLVSYFAGGGALGTDGAQGLVSQTAFALRGITAGEDTLVLNATGFPTATVPITVQPGILRIAANTPSVMAQGDSVRVTLNLAGPDGTSGAITAAPSTLTFTSSTNFVVTNGSSVITTLLIPADATSVSFWVRAAGSGTGSLTITSPNFRTLSATFQTRAP